MRSNQRKQLVKLGLQGNSRHGLSVWWNADSIAPLKVARKDYCDK
jgi:hypothetical protein